MFSAPRLFLFALLAMGGLSAQAVDVRVSGLGIRKCSEWTQWKTAQNGEARATTVEWAQGFIAGHNVYAKVNNAQANSVVVDNKIVATLLDSFCQRSPDERLLSGVVDIVQSLGGAKVNMTPTKPQAPATPESRPPGRES